MNLKRTIQFIVSLLSAFALSALFIYSGFSKLYPIEYFDNIISQVSSLPLSVSVYVSRLIIGFEFFIAVALLFQLFSRKQALVVVSGTLLFFIGILLWQIAKYGNVGNCGCFGMATSMTPVQGILKNVALFGLLAIYYFSFFEFPYRYKTIGLAVVLIICLVLPFILNTIDINSVRKNTAQDIGTTINLDKLYDGTPNKAPAIELRKGKHIVAFFSLTCPHCKIAAQRMKVIHQEYPEIPVYMLLNGKPHELQPFLDETHTADVPHSIFNGPDEWVKMAGVQLPSVYWINNSVIEKHTSSEGLTPDGASKWYK